MDSHRRRIKSVSYERKSQALDFVLNANRNLMLVMAVVFCMCNFAINADNVLKGSSISAICIGLGITLILLTSIIHATMVYKYDEMVVPGEPQYWWYLIPFSTVIIVTVPLVVYLFLLY